MTDVDRADRERQHAERMLKMSVVTRRKLVLRPRYDEVWRDMVQVYFSRPDVDHRQLIVGARKFWDMFEQAAPIADGGPSSLGRDVLKAVTGTIHSDPILRVQAHEQFARTFSIFLPSVKPSGRSGLQGPLSGVWAGPHASAGAVQHHTANSSGNGYSLGFELQGEFDELRLRDVKSYVSAEMIAASVLAPSTFINMTAT